MRRRNFLSLGLAFATGAALSGCSKAKDKGNLLGEPKFKAGAVFGGHPGRANKKKAGSDFGVAPKGKAKKKSFDL